MKRTSPQMQMLRATIGRVTAMSRALVERAISSKREGTSGATIHTDASRKHAGFRIETADHAVQTLAPPTAAQRFEGIAFSPSGHTLGVATSDTNTVFLFRRKADGRFEDEPYSTIAGTASRLNYPHDLSFSSSGNAEFLAVAQRSGSICIYGKDNATNGYVSAPSFEIQGGTAKLDYSDGVAFVPPDDEYLAACNLSVSSLTFYRKIPGALFGFTREPVFELKHHSIRDPDGLAFSSCGRWLAVANHGAQTVSIHAREASRESIRYRPEPVTLISDPGLRYPHSVAFTPKTNHLLVTNAGANYFSVYAPERDSSQGMRWSQTPVLRQVVGADRAFRQVNARNKMEGGPKGIAVHDNKLAVCSPEHGIKIYSFIE